MENHQPIAAPTPPPANIPPAASALPTTPNMDIGQPMPPAVPHSSSKRPLILVLILIILALSAIAVFYLINQPVPQAPSITPQPVQPQPTSAPLPTAVPNETAPIEDDLQSLDVTNDLTSEFADINADLQQL